MCRCRQPAPVFPTTHFRASRSHINCIKFYKRQNRACAEIPRGKNSCSSRQSPGSHHFRSVQVLTARLQHHYVMMITILCDGGGCPAGRATRILAKQTVSQW